MIIYRNNGYFKLTRDDLYAEVDTVLVGLIDPTLDPFEQIRLLTEGLKKKQNPTISIELKQAPPKDSSHLFQYKVGEVFIYPDVPLRATILTHSQPLRCAASPSGRAKICSDRER
jgi:hypothetical protein